MSEHIEQKWAIFRRTAQEMIYMGEVTASDEDRAVKIAIDQLPVTNPHHQQKLVARRQPARSD